jgi:hypothetical protein
MGESNNEEATDYNDRGGGVERGGGMPDLRLVAPAGLPAVPAHGDVFQPLRNHCKRMRSVLQCADSDDRAVEKT